MAAAAAAIEARGLTKGFGSGIVAVSALDLRVERGEVYGLIGRNGAGKTTTLRLLMGLLKAESGEARILGVDLWSAPRSHRQRVAYVSQGLPTPGWMTLEDLCRYTSHFHERWDGALAAELARRWELDADRPIVRLSGGQQRLAALLAAIAARPDVLILDEPAAGLDPIARSSLNECLIETLMRGEGCTVLLSTHLIGDLERLATRVGIMDRGRILLEGEVDEWQRTLRRVQVVFEGGVPECFAIPGALRTEVMGPVVTAVARIADEGQLAPVRGIGGARVFVFPLTLEEVFLELFRQPTVVGGGFGQPGVRVADEHNDRVGSGSSTTVAPALRVSD